MNDSKIIEKLKQLTEEGTKLKANLSMSKHSVSVESHNKPYYQDAERWKGKCLNLLKLRFGINSHYYLNFSQEINVEYRYAGEYCQDNVGKALGALEWVLDALESGLTEDLFYKKEILFFSDLLKQAFEFFDKGFKLASAIYGRIVLESVICEFAEKNGIEKEKFDSLIIKLRQKGLIHKPLEDSLRANYKIGSWATHSDEEFEKLSDIEIREFLSFIRDRILTIN